MATHQRETALIVSWTFCNLLHDFYFHQCECAALTLVFWSPAWSLIHYYQEQVHPIPAHPFEGYSRPQKLSSFSLIFSSHFCSFLSFGAVVEISQARMKSMHMHVTVRIRVF